MPDILQNLLDRTYDPTLMSPFPGETPEQFQARMAAQQQGQIPQPQQANYGPQGQPPQPPPPAAPAPGAAPYLQPPQTIDPNAVSPEVTTPYQQPKSLMDRWNQLTSQTAPTGQPLSLIERLTGQTKPKSMDELIERATGAAPAPATPDTTSPEVTTAYTPLASAADKAGALPSKIPLPRSRPSGAPQRDASGEPIGGADGGATPARSTPISSQGGAPVDAAAQAGMLSSQGSNPLANFGSNLMRGLSAHSNLLLALGAGFAGAPNIGQGISRAAAAAVQGNQADIQNAMQSGSQTAMYQALRASGASPAMAQAGALNKDVGKAMLGSYIDPKYEIKEVKTKNAWGEEASELYAINPRDPTDVLNVRTGQRIGGAEAQAAGGGQRVGILNAQGGFVPADKDQAQRVASGTAGGGGGGAVATPPAAPTSAGTNAPQPAIGGGPQQSEFYAPGFNDQNLDWSKSGEDFLNQFGEPVKAAVQARLAGMTPAGRAAGMGAGMGKLNARIGMIAQKYGQDIGHPDDPTKYNQRNQYATGLANPKSGVGQKKWGFQQATEHLSDITDNLVKMKLANVPFIMGGELTSEQINKIKGISPDQKNLINANKLLISSLSRELGNMTGGGGVHEAKDRSDALGGNFGSGKAAAGAVEGVTELMQGSLKTLESERDDLFPDARYRPQGSVFLGPRQQALFDHIQQNIAILKGEAPRPAAGAATAAAPQIKPGGTYNWNRSTGTFTAQ